MSRVIKFRAFIQKKRMVYQEGHRFEFQGNFDIYRIYQDDELGNRGDMIANDKSAYLMQFTGLTDKNGKEIYEGDVTLRQPDDDRSHQWYEKVVWVDGGVVGSDDYDPIKILGFGLEMIPGRFMRKPVVDVTLRYHAFQNNDPIVQEYGVQPLYEGTDLEVIGNIYENPELLNN